MVHIKKSLKNKIKQNKDSLVHNTVYNANRTLHLGILALSSRKWLWFILVEGDFLKKDIE